MSVGIAPYAGIVLNSFTFMSAVIPDAVINLPMICFINFCVAIGIFIALAILFKILIATKRIVPEFEMGNSDIVLAENIPFNNKIKWGFFYVALLMAIMLMPYFLPKTSAIAVFLKRIGMLGMFSVIVTMMCLTTVDGERLLDFEAAARNGAISWQVYFMMGAALIISGQLVTDEAGLAITIENALGGIVGNMSPYILCFVFICFGLILTNCITNVVAMQLTIPVLAIFLSAKGIDPVLISGLCGAVLLYGQVLPSGSPSGAYVHGVEWMDEKLCYLYTICCSICIMISVASIGIPIALALS